MLYAAVDPSGRWLAVLVFSAAAKHLKHRDQWIHWTRAQRDRRLSLVANNARFLILPEARQPNLGSRVLRLALQRLGPDWQDRYGHPVLVVETFVDPEHFQGTVYTAQGWQELGLTDGHGRHRRDFYIAHNKPKRLFVRELARNARRSLQAEHLRPALASVEKKAGARSYHKEAELRSLAEHFKDMPDYRSRTESYPPKALATLILLGMLCDAPRGQKDLVKLARRLTPNQRRAIGIRPSPDGSFPAPGQSTFSRFLARVDAGALQKRLLQVQAKVRGHPPGRGTDRGGREGAAARAGRDDPRCRDRPRPVPHGLRAGRHQDQRDPRGARTLRDHGPGREDGVDGCAPHLRANGEGTGDGTRGALPADGQGEPSRVETEHRHRRGSAHGGFSPLHPEVAPRPGRSRGTGASVRSARW